MLHRDGPAAPLLTRLARLNCFREVSEGGAGARGAHLVLIADHDDTRNSLSMLPHVEGYVVETATSVLPTDRGLDDSNHLRSARLPHTMKSVRATSLCCRTVIRCAMPLAEHDVGMLTAHARACKRVAPSERLRDAATIGDVLFYFAIDIVR